MKKIVLVLFLLASCAVLPAEVNTKHDNAFLDDPFFCNVDADCTCGGVDTHVNKCFLGNKLYSSMYVDLSQDCPDFCTGIAGNLEIKCIDHVCQQKVREDLACTEEAKLCPDGSFVVRVGPDCEFQLCPGETKCVKDEDCVPDSCCHPTGCTLKSNAPLCDTMMCTEECAAGTLDCGGSCACVDGECVGQDYFK